VLGECLRARLRFSLEWSVIVLIAVGRAARAWLAVSEIDSL
jgi:hypothetical protein